MTETIYKVLEQKIEINDIVDIVVTTIEAHPEGGYVREIRFTGSYDENSGVSGSPRSLTLRVRGAERTDIDITTPTLTF